MRTSLNLRTSSIPVLAALAAILLSVPGSVHAQGTSPQGGDSGAGARSETDTEQPRLSRHAERFMMLYDLNNDGKVTIEEINDDQARMFTAMDVDGDKSMSVEEIRRRGRMLQTFRTTTLFDLLDADGDGKLSLAEVQAPSKRWFKRYDANGDGVLEASEIPARREHRGRGRGSR